MGRRLRPYLKLLVVLGALGAVNAATEGVAFWLHLWHDNPALILPLRLFGAQVETYVINALLFPAIGAATLLLIPYFDRRRRAAGRKKA